MRVGSIESGGLWVCLSCCPLRRVPLAMPVLFCPDIGVKHRQQCFRVIRLFGRSAYGLNIPASVVILPDLWPPVYPMPSVLCLVTGTHSRQILDCKIRPRNTGTPVTPGVQPVIDNLPPVLHAAIVTNRPAPCNLWAPRPTGSRTGGTRTCADAGRFSRVHSRSCALTRPGRVGRYRRRGGVCGGAPSIVSSGRPGSTGRHGVGASLPRRPPARTFRCPSCGG